MRWYYNINNKVYRPNEGLVFIAPNNETARGDVSRLNSQLAVEHGVQSDLKPCPHGNRYLIGDPPFCTECVLDEEAASSR